MRKLLTSISTRNRFKGFLRRLVLSTVLVSIFFILIQDFLIFPQLWLRTLWSNDSLIQKLPKSIELVQLKGVDENRILLWKQSARVSLEESAEKKKVVLIFPGNGMSYRSLYPVQQWFAKLGFTSYQLGYRGHNGNEGWPSEENLYRDTDSVLEYLEEKHPRTNTRFLFFGISVGTGVAAYAAKTFAPEMLTLLSPYVSLRQAASETPLFGFLSPFLWYEIPTLQFLSNLTSTKILLAHGKKDSVIGYHHSQIIHKALEASEQQVHFIRSQVSGHNDLLSNIKRELAYDFRGMLEEPLDERTSEVDREELPPT